MNRHIPVSLLKTVVFANVMKIISADHDGSLHLHFLDNSGEDTSTDGNVTGEGTFLVDVGPFDGLLFRK